MRVIIAAGLAATLGLAACGCSSTKMPSLPTFGFKGKSAKSNPSSLTNAPPAPKFNSMAAGAPSVSMPPATAWSNLPVYPGTPYQQTPYPEQQIASASAAPAYSGYPQSSGPVTTVPLDPAAGGYAPSYSAMPPGASEAPPYAGQQAPQYAPGQAPPYPQPQASPYAQGQTTPSAQQQAQPYAQQQTPPYAQGQATPSAQQQAQPYAQQQTSPYAAPPASPYAAQQVPSYAGQQAPSYAPQQDPYDGSPQPYNAANPYGTYTR
jgi:hypothetical protein